MLIPPFVPLSVGSAGEIKSNSAVCRLSRRSLIYCPRIEAGFVEQVFRCLVFLHVFFCWRRPLNTLQGNLPAATNTVTGHIGIVKNIIAAAT